MQTQTLNSTNIPTKERGITEILGDLYRNSVGIAQQEITIIKEETKSVGQKTAFHTVLLAGFGLLTILSVLPLIAFLVIGLGRLMDDNYWASSLIVGLVLLAIGGGVSYYALSKVKQDLTFPRTKTTLKRIVDFFESETRKLKKDEVYSHGTNH
jgi:uncharacterized membrane protein YqjE